MGVLLPQQVVPSPREGPLIAWVRLSGASLPGSPRFGKTALAALRRQSGHQTVSQDDRFFKMILFFLNKLLHFRKTWFISFSLFFVSVP
jgi:hypothetical protein